jgi:hypothetical protein
MNQYDAAHHFGRLMGSIHGWLAGNRMDYSPSFNIDRAISNAIGFASI